MKNIIITVCFILVAQSLWARADTTTIEQYCQVTATPRLFSNKVIIDIDCGEQKSFWSNTRLREWDGQLKKFNTIIDAMNYMGKEGWGFINATLFAMVATTIYTTIASKNNSAGQSYFTDPGWVVC